MRIAILRKCTISWKHKKFLGNNILLHPLTISNSCLLETGSIFLLAEENCTPNSAILVVTTSLLSSPVILWFWQLGVLMGNLTSSTHIQFTESRKRQWSCPGWNREFSRSLDVARRLAVGASKPLQCEAQHNFEKETCWIIYLLNCSTVVSFQRLHAFNKSWRHFEFLINHVIRG